MKLLVCSAGQKAPLVRAAQRAVSASFPAGSVVVGDASVNSRAQFLSDEFWRMPTTEQVNLEQIIQGCLTRGIEAILPTREEDLDFFARNYSVFENFGVEPIVSSLHAVQLCNDKFEFFCFAKELGVRVVPTYLSISEVDCEQLVVKERFGSGSRGLGLNLDRDKASLQAAHTAIPIYQPFLDGVEVSIDGWADKSGEIAGVVLRERLMIEDGEARVTRTFRDADLEALAVDFAQNLHLRGPFVIQAIMHEGEWIFLECNARYGGMSTTSQHVGLDSLLWSLIEIRDPEFKPSFQRSDHDVTVVRLPQDLVFDDLDI